MVIFLPIATAVFYVVPMVLRTTVLFVASVGFYAVSGLVPAGLLVATLVWGFVFAATIHLMRRNPAYLLVGVFVPIAVLFLFKYLDFTLSATGADETTRESFSFFLQIALPAGISFYTFQIVSYMVDVYDEKFCVEKKFSRYAAFISFFPQLIAGPILRYEQMYPQLCRIETQRDLNPDWVSGLKFFSFGLFYKIAFADIIRTMIFYGNTGTGPVDAIWLIFAYSILIYFDFWGYSLMAIGIAKFFSIDLPRNFLEPYRAKSPRDFWKRWHVTLSYWLRDYLYIKLGGNRSYIRNIAVVFIAAGIWHGAGWSFMTWGLYHGCAVILYHVYRKQWDRLPAPVAIGATFVVISFSWPLFFMDFSAYAALLSQITSVSEPLGPTSYKTIHWLYLAVTMGWVFLFRENKWLFNSATRAFFDSPILHATMAFGAILFFEFGQTFIYFRF